MQTFYEEYYEEFNSFISNRSFMQDDIIAKRLFEIYRGVNIFPITYYDTNDIKNTIRKKLIKETGIIKDKTLLIKTHTGGVMLMSHFINLHKVKSDKKFSIYEAFYDDTLLKKSIDCLLKYNKVSPDFKPDGMYRGLKMVMGHTASNFSSSRARVVYETYCPKDGVIYDYSCGFGGRMLAALTSLNNYSYIGVEPNVETYEKLNILGDLILKVKDEIVDIDSLFSNTEPTKSKFEIFNTGSEDFNYGSSTIDFSFSSPPYFDLERYCDSDTQCYNKYNTVELWIEHYVKPTIKNTYDMLKPNAYYAVNIADFKRKGKIIPLFDIWRNCAIESGFEFVEIIKMPLQVKVVSLKVETEKNEGILIFRKK